MSSQLEIAAATLTGPEQTIEKQNAARSLVAAQLDLLRIRNVRARLAQEIGTSPETRLLRRLLALDRYERLARTKRKRNAEKL